MRTIVIYDEVSLPLTHRVYSKTKPDVNKHFIMNCRRGSEYLFYSRLCELCSFVSVSSLRMNVFVAQNVSRVSTYLILEERNFIAVPSA
jgi:hypothetical protein